LKELSSEKYILFKEYQKILGYYLLWKVNFNEKIYLPCFIDNRGRQYYGTLISPTFYKLYRYLYKFSKIKKFEDLEESTFYKKIILYKSCVKDFSLDNDENIYILIILFIEVGKFYIKEGMKYMFGTDELIYKGIENYNKRNLSADDLYINKIFVLIDKVLSNNEIDINTIIYKDATASGLQNQGMLFKYKKGILKFLNMDGDTYCDTYLYVIDRFLETDIDYLKDRKILKYTIMTIPYNAT
jgi:hypothetical protein